MRCFSIYGFIYSHATRFKDSLVLYSVALGRYEQTSVIPKGAVFSSLQKCFAPTPPALKLPVHLRTTCRVLKMIRPGTHNRLIKSEFLSVSPRHMLENNSLDDTSVLLGLTSMDPEGNVMILLHSNGNSKHIWGDENDMR